MFLASCCYILFATYHDGLRFRSLGLPKRLAIADVQPWPCCHFQWPWRNAASWGDEGECAYGAHLHFTARQSVNWSNPLGSGTPLVVSDLRGTGWYPWWPHPDRNSGYVVQVTSHTVGSCSYTRKIAARWPPTSWVAGGNYIDGYSWAWTTSSTTVPDTVKDGEETVTSTTSPTLGIGNWWFHFRVRDTAGNWASSSEVAHLGPFCICVSGCPTSVEE